MGAYDSKQLLAAIEARECRRVKRIVRRTGKRFELAQNATGLPPLCLAASLGSEELVLVLLMRGRFDVNLPDDHCWFPIHHAARAGACHVLHVLIHQARADVTSRCHVSTCRCKKHTALHAAVLGGHYQAVTTLLQGCGEEVVAARDSQGRTPAQLAECEGHADIATLLQEAEVTGLHSPPGSVRKPTKTLQYA